MYFVPNYTIRSAIILGPLLTIIIFITGPVYILLYCIDKLGIKYYSFIVFWRI